MDKEIDEMNGGMSSHRSGRVPEEGVTFSEFGETEERRYYADSNDFDGFSKEVVFVHRIDKTDMGRPIPDPIIVYTEEDLFVRWDRFESDGRGAAIQKMTETEFTSKYIYALNIVSDWY